MPEFTDEQTWEFWQRLEAERNDLGYKTIRRRPVARPESEQKERDKVFFDAGRFAEGARDTDALKANKEIGKYIFGGKK